MAATATVTATLTPQSLPSGTEPPGTKFRFSLDPPTGANQNQTVDGPTCTWTGLQPGVHTFGVSHLKADGVTPWGTAVTVIHDIPADVVITIQVATGVTVQVVQGT